MYMYVYVGWPIGWQCFWNGGLIRSNPTQKMESKNCRGWASQVMALNDWKKMSGPAFEEVSPGQGMDGINTKQKQAGGVHGPW